MVTSQMRGKLGLCAYIFPNNLSIDIARYYTLTIPEGETCITDSGKTGKCLLIENCPAALALVRNKRRPKVCSFQGRTPIVCCGDVVSKTLSIATKSKYSAPIIGISLYYSQT